MTLREALEGLPDDRRDALLQKLQKLAGQNAVCYRAVSNLHLETRLSAEGWKELLLNLSSCTADPGACSKVMTDVFRRLILTGPEVRVEALRYGRAISVTRFCSMLVKQGHYASVASARRALRSLIFKPTEVLVTRCAEFQLGQYLMWSTFSVDNPRKGPFEGVGTSADSIRGVLGLDRLERGMPLLLLEYTLPESVALRIPTIADAYAGTGWSYFFQPAPIGLLFGMTLPWPEYENEKPRPEIVHSVITGSQLSGPIQEIL